MWQSLRISHLILRLSLAAVFLWFGIDKFFHPGHWISSWIPQYVINVVGFLHISANAFVYSMGVVELLIGISLAANMFIDFFALVAAIMLVIVSLTHGLSDVLIRDIGLIGALLALVFWPNPGLRRYS